MATTEPLHRQLTAQKVDGVRTVDTVRHVDELSETAQQRFYELVGAGSSDSGLEGADFEVGDVIVFTDYYRIERR